VDGDAGVVSDTLWIALMNDGPRRVHITPRISCEGRGGP
jgi:hypothetical protein